MTLWRLHGASLTHCSLIELTGNCSVSRFDWYCDFENTAPFHVSNILRRFNECDANFRSKRDNRFVASESFFVIYYRDRKQSTDSTHLRARVCVCVFLKRSIFFSGEGHINSRVKRSRGQMSRDRVRRRPRTVPRFDGIVPYRRTLARHQLFIHGRLRRQGILQCWNCNTPRRVESKFIFCASKWLFWKKLF